VPGTFENGSRRKKLAITALLPDAQLTVPRDQNATPIPIPEVGVALNRTLAELLDVQAGEMITFRPSVGQRRPIEMPVAAITDGFLGLSAYAQIPYLSRAIGEEETYSAVQLATDGDPEQTRKLYAELKQLPGIQSVGVRGEMIANLEHTFADFMNAFLVVLVLFAGVIFFGTILNVSLVTLSQRKRELATLAVLGYGPWRIGGLLLRESLSITILGTCLGMPLGYGFALLVAMTNKSELFRFPVISSWSVWITTLLTAAIFSLIAQLVVQAMIHRTDWVEALQTRE